MIERRDGPFWHKTDIPPAPSNVRYRGKADAGLRTPDLGSRHKPGVKEGLQKIGTPGDAARFFAEEAAFWEKVTRENKLSGH